MGAPMGQWHFHFNTYFNYLLLWLETLSLATIQCIWFHNLSMHFCLIVMRVFKESISKSRQRQARMHFSIFNTFCILRTCVYFYFILKQFKQLIWFEGEMGITKTMLSKSWSTSLLRYFNIYKEHRFTVLAVLIHWLS